LEGFLEEKIGYGISKPPSSYLEKEGRSLALIRKRDGTMLWENFQEGVVSLPPLEIV